MPIPRFIARLVALWLVSTITIFAAQNALIVIGTTGSTSIASDLAGTAQSIKDSLIKRGFAPDAVTILQTTTASKVSRDAVLAELKKEQILTNADELWLVLLGFSGPSSDGSLAFQVPGPRVTVTDLKTSLDAIPAKQFVFVGTSDSGGFIPALLQNNRDVLAATKEQGEVDLPRFPESWAAALKENPQMGWKELAARAAEINDKTYADSNLAVGEHARLGDPATGKILQAPFGVAATAQPEQKPQTDNSMDLVNASDIKVDIRKPNQEWEQHEATPETKKMIADAKAVPNPDGFNAIMLTQKLGYKIGEDRTVEETVMQRVYIEKEDGVERWANYTFPQDPPVITTKLDAARIIQPDGTSTVFNPAKMPAATAITSDMTSALTTVFMPNAHAGCLIEIAYRTRHLLDTSLPEFAEELPVQIDVPVLHTDLAITSADTVHLHFKLRNSDQKPETAQADGFHSLSWKLDNTPAFESLPFDPPARDWLISLDISSLDSWDQFATWYRRLAKGSDIQDATVKAKAGELAEGAKTRLEKIKRAFEFVSALRYVAIEFGVNGIRPRTPAVVLQNRYGDCKDKANLLVALLADMGINGNFVVLNRGSSTDVDFPSWQFNHAIAYVPKAPDAGQPEDLWLDTTDSTAPFPTLPPGDIGRNALVFDKESAKFLPVTAAKGNEITEIKEAWKFKVADNAPIQGTLQKSWTGLAEYDVRSGVRGRTPRQRDFMLQEELTHQLGDGDFTNLKLTPADDLSVPMGLTADVSVSSNRYWPKTGFDIASYFATPERNRPLLLNNGQKMHLLQTVALEGQAHAPIDPPVPFDQKAAGIEAKISWDHKGDDWVRTVELIIDQPLVAASDYAAVRKILRDWNSQLSH